MRELLRRLALRPFLSLELLAATLLVTILNLASPLFVIQVLNRYITFGFDGTLVTLTAGMLIAVVLLFGFSVARTRLALAVSAEPDEELAAAVYSALARIRPMALDRVTRDRAGEILYKLQTVQAAYEGPNITAILDAPFSLLYIVAALLLSPALAFIGVIGMAFMLLAGWSSLVMSRRTIRELNEVSARQRTHTAGTLSGPDTVRAFRGLEFLRPLWRELLGRESELRARLAGSRERFQTISLTVITLTSVLVYALGAMEVVEGVISMGALIGVNILTSRAIQSISRFVNAHDQMRRGVEAQLDIQRFLALPLEPEVGTAMRQYSGKLEMKDVALGFPGSTGPLFESLNLKLEPGSVLVVTGPNGSGKTSMARLLAGLIDPTRGEILADGVNLRQLAPPWWRGQIMYLPQEPTFLNTTIRENIRMAAPDTDEGRLNALVNQANLGRFLYSSPTGLDTPLADGGRSLPMGIRRRLALARALATDGRLVIMDEPTEALDAEGCAAVYSLLNTLASQGRTIVAMTSDPRILKGAKRILNLGVKPVPRMETPARPGARPGTAAMPAKRQ